MNIDQTRYILFFHDDKVSGVAGKEEKAIAFPAELQKRLKANVKEHMSYKLKSKMMLRPSAKLLLMRTLQTEKDLKVLQERLFEEYESPRVVLKNKTNVKWPPKPRKRSTQHLPRNIGEFLDPIKIESNNESTVRVLSDGEGCDKIATEAKKKPRKSSSYTATYEYLPDTKFVTSSFIRFRALSIIQEKKTLGMR